METIASAKSLCVPFKEATTASAPARERLRYWEAYSASELVGLRCSTYAEEGLQARQRNFDLGALRIADIVGNEHVIERNMPIVRRLPKDSLFACLLLEGEAFFYQSGRCELVHSGDLIVYNTAKPYLYGFTRPMRQLMVDVTADELFGSGRGISQLPALRIDGSLRAGRMLIQPLQERILEFIDRPLADAVPALHEEVSARLRMLLQPALSEAPRGADISGLRLLKAERFISDHLAEQELDAEAVASHVAMSVRNLNRLFEKHDCSVTQWIWQERIKLAYRQLLDPAHGSRSIGEIALGCGFSTHAHFAREFKSRYGLTPTQVRRAPIGERP